MYLDYYRLKEAPFNLTPDPKFIYFTDGHRSALETILYGIRERKGFMILTGEVGTGKTTLVRELLNQLDDGVETSLLLNPMLSTQDLIRAINKDFGLEPNSTSIIDQIDELNRFLLCQQQQGKNAVVIIDEAQNLSLEALEMVRLLSNLETEKDKLLQIILVGQQELLEKLSCREMRQLNQRIQVRSHLGPMNFQTTKEYIFYRLRTAGAIGSVQFEEKSLKEIFKLSQGYPRLINVICDRTLLATFTQDQKTVTKRCAREAYRDALGQNKSSFAFFNVWRKWWPAGLAFVAGLMLAGAWWLSQSRPLTQHRPLPQMVVPAADEDQADDTTATLLPDLFGDV